MSQNTALAEDVAIPDLEAYRLEVRAWLRRQHGTSGGSARTP